MTQSTSASTISPTFERLKLLYPKRSEDQLAGFADRIEAHERDQKEPVAWIVTSDGRLLVFRRPDQDEWEEAGERIRKGERLAVINRELALKTTLEVSADELPAVFKRWPGIHARIGDALTRLVGADEELVVKKE